MLDISVIIACFNGAATLAEALDSLVTQQWSRPWEIVLADNGSTDASVQIFEDYARRHPDIPMWVVDAGRRQGKAYALNTAILAAHGRALLFCDTDDTVAPGWLAAMGAALDLHAFVAARMDIRALNPEWTLAQRGQAQQHGLGKLPHAPDCPLAAGATQGFRREVFDTLGGFDTDFIFLEDLDFCVRAHLAGFTLQFVPEAVVNYRFRDDLAGIDPAGLCLFPLPGAAAPALCGGVRAVPRTLAGARPPDRAPATAAPGLGAAARATEPQRPGALPAQPRPDAMGQLSGALAFRVAPPRPAAAAPEVGSARRDPCSGTNRPGGTEPLQPSPGPPGDAVAPVQTGSRAFQRSVRSTCPVSCK